MRERFRLLLHAQTAKNEARGLTRSFYCWRHCLAVHHFETRTDTMHRMHLSLEEKLAVEKSARVKARLLDAVHIHYQNVQAMTVMRFFSKWRQTIVLDKSNQLFLEVAVSPPPHLISSHLFSPRIFSMDLMSTYFISPSLPQLIFLYLTSKIIASHLFFSILSHLVLIAVSCRRHTR